MYERRIWAVVQAHLFVQSLQSVSVLFCVLCDSKWRSTDCVPASWRSPGRVWAVRQRSSQRKCDCRAASDEAAHSTWSTAPWRHLQSPARRRHAAAGCSVDHRRRRTTTSRTRRQRPADDGRARTRRIPRRPSCCARRRHTAPTTSLPPSLRWRSRWSTVETGWRHGHRRRQPACPLVATATRHRRLRSCDRWRRAEAAWRRPAARGRQHSASSAEPSQTSSTTPSNQPHTVMICTPLPSNARCLQNRRTGQRRVFRKNNKYVRLPYCRTEIYAGRISCCPLMSYVKYAPRALLMLEKRRDRWTDGHQTVTLRLLLDAASVITSANMDL